MAYITAVTNQKGGVAKTTTCINLGASLVVTKRRVLVVDMDPQGNATVGSGYEKRSTVPTVHDVLMGRKKISQAIIKKTRALYDLLPANRDLTAAEVNLLGKKGNHKVLRKALNRVSAGYDYIFIDCPPSLNILTVNAMGAADGLLVPVQCEYFALEGLTDLVRTVQGIQSSINSRLEIEGLLRTLYDKRNRLTREVSDELLKVFGPKVYNVIIPRNVKLAEAPSYGLPVVSYDKHSSGSITYLALAGEFMRRHEDK